MHAPVQREKVESPLANVVCRYDCDPTFWVGKPLFCNTYKSQVAFCGISGKTRGCRNWLALLERVVPLLWGAVGGSLILPAPHFSASPTGTSDLGNPDENPVIKKFLFAFAGLWMSWHETPQTPAVVRYNQSRGSLGKSNLLPWKQTNPMDLLDFCASPGVCCHHFTMHSTLVAMQGSASGERQEFVPDPLSNPPMSWTVWFHHLCHYFTFQLSSYRYH